MKLFFWTTGGLFFAVVSIIPLFDTGLVTALSFAGGCFCLSAFALEVHPVVEMLVENSEEKRAQQFREQFLEEQRLKKHADAKLAESTQPLLGS